MAQEAPVNQGTIGWPIRDWRVFGKYRNYRFGDILISENKLSRSLEIIKIFPRITDNMQADQAFCQELKAMRILRDVYGVVSLMAWNDYDLRDHRYLVYEHLDVTLDELRFRNRRMLFRPTTTLHLLWSMMNIIQSIHNYGIFHQNVDLNHMMIEYHSDNLSRLKFIGFGNSATPSEAACLPSTVNFLKMPFSSPNVRDGVAFTASEEMASFALVSIVMATGTCPWYNNSIGMMTSNKTEILNAPAKHLAPQFHYLIPFILNVNHLDYGCPVDYDALRNIIKKEFFKFFSEKELKEFDAKKKSPLNGYFNVYCNNINEMFLQ